MRGCHSLPLQLKDWKRSNNLIRRYWFHELEFSVVFFSLNREKRQRELLRVTKENQEVLKRILNRKPEYHRSKWQKDWEHNLKFMDNISAYPPNWWQQVCNRYNNNKLVKTWLQNIVNHPLGVLRKKNTKDLIIINLSHSVTLNIFKW